MKKVLKAKGIAGFTLVELMVVVAIIGILSAIAVPNFKKYQAKSKQSEAKINLSALYNVEVGANADYDTYATCIFDLGFENAAKGYYYVGFSVATSTTNAQMITSRGGSCVTNIGPGSTFDSPSNYLKITTATGLSAGNATQTTFSANAMGNISTTKIDAWSIDQNKNARNNSAGY